MVPAKMFQKGVSRSSVSGIASPAERIMINPRRRKFIPRVDTSEERPTRVTSMPFRKPQRAPVSRAAIRAITGLAPALTIMANTMAANPMIEGKERSISPLATTNTFAVTRMIEAPRVVKTAM